MLHYEAVDYKNTLCRHRLHKRFVSKVDVIGSVSSCSNKQTKKTIIEHRCKFESVRLGREVLMLNAAAKFRSFSSSMSSFFLHRFIIPKEHSCACIAVSVPVIWLCNMNVSVPLAVILKSYCLWSNAIKIQRLFSAQVIRTQFSDGNQWSKWDTTGLTIKWLRIFSLSGIELTISAIT